MNDIDIIRKAVEYDHPLEDVHGAIDRVESLIADLQRRLEQWEE